MAFLPRLGPLTYGIVPPHAKRRTRQRPAQPVKSPNSPQGPGGPRRFGALGTGQDPRPSQPSVPQEVRPFLRDPPSLTTAEYVISPWLDPPAQGWPKLDPRTPRHRDPAPDRPRPRAAQSTSRNFGPHTIALALPVLQAERRHPHRLHHRRAGSALKDAIAKLPPEMPGASPATKRPRPLQRRHTCPNKAVVDQLAPSAAA